MLLVGCAFKEETDDTAYVLSAPTSLSATGGDQQVVLDWTAVSGASSYTVYWGTSSGISSSSTTLSNISTDNYTHTGLSYGTTYYYKVAAVDANGTGTLSSEVSTTPASSSSDNSTTTSTLSAPSGLTATGGNQQVVLDWTAVSGASSYTVYWDNASGITTSDSGITSITTDNYTHTGRNNGTTYYYKVAAVDASGTGSLSSEVNATAADTTAPTSPSISINSGAANSTSDNVTLTLSAGDTVGVTGYYASETSTTPASSASGWTSVTSATSYSGSVSFTLSSGYASKTVYVWFQDTAGNVSAVASDSITTIAPLTVVISNSYTYSGTTYSSSNLEWQLATGTGNDGLSTGLTWSNDKLTINWDNATSYCSNLSLDAHTDWRLPTKEELASIADTTNNSSAPYIVSALQATTPSTKKYNMYWSSTTYVWENYAWGLFVNNNGIVDSGSKSSRYYVRCVRG